MLMTDHDLLALVRARLATTTIAEAARATGLHRNTLSALKHGHQAGIYSLTRWKLMGWLGIAPTVADHARVRFRAGASIADLAQRFDVDHETIKIWLWEGL